MTRPEVSEYKPSFQYYIDLVDDGDFFEVFANNTKKTLDYFKNIPTESLNYKYADDKWTIKQILMHIIDNERSLGYKVFVCGRGDTKTPLYRMDENLYNKNIDVVNRTIESLLTEFEIIRANSVILFENLSDKQSKFLGNAISYNISSRALGYIMIGHINHHINIITERYL